MAYDSYQITEWKFPEHDFNGHTARSYMVVLGTTEPETLKDYLEDILEKGLIK